MNAATASTSLITKKQEYWYYVDPYKEEVSKHRVNKYELKRLFIQQYINKHCLIWNESYKDYIAIHQVPDLLQFLFDGTSNNNEDQTSFSNNDHPDYWYYVDPYKEQVSKEPVSKYKLKDMFIQKYINQHCLIWNESYDDYVEIHQVPDLLQFLLDGIAKIKHKSQVYENQPYDRFDNKSLPIKPVSNNDKYVSNNENHCWYYVDPHKAKVAQEPVSKYKLKDMFIKQYINGHCLVWNGKYDDYIAINEVPNLVAFLEEKTAKNRDKVQVLDEAVVDTKDVNMQTWNNTNGRNKWMDTDAMKQQRHRRQELFEVLRRYGIDKKSRKIGKSNKRNQFRYHDKIPKLNKSYRSNRKYKYHRW